MSFSTRRAASAAAAATVSIVLPPSLGAETQDSGATFPEQYRFRISLTDAVARRKVHINQGFGVSKWEISVE